MKRTVSKLLVALLMMTMVMALVSCGGGSKSEYVGTWHATEISAYGVTMTPEDAGMEFTMEIKDDGPSPLPPTAKMTVRAPGKRPTAVSTSPMTPAKRSTAHSKTVS